MGLSGRKKVAGFNTSLQQRGLRVQKQIGLGPFRFNVGTYFGGTHHGRVTGRTSAGFGGIRWSKERTLNSGQGYRGPGAEFDTDDLSDVFDIDEEYEDTTPFLLTSIGVLIVNALLFIASIVLFAYFPLQIWTLVPVYGGLLFTLIALYVSPYFSLFIGAKQWFVYPPMLCWIIVMTMALLIKTYLIY